VLGVEIGGRLLGWLAVGALWGMVPFWTSAAEARVDMVFSACVTTALVAFFLWYRRGGRVARALCYLGVTLAVLTKGPAGLILVGVVIAAFHLVQRDFRRLCDLWSWPLAGAALAAIGGWYAAATWVGGREFLEKQLLHENLERFVGQGEFQPHRWRNPLRMEIGLATQLLPWSLVLVWVARRWLAGEREEVAGRFLHVWWMGILAFFTVAAGKRGVYLLPLYPAVALLAARVLTAALPHVDATRVPAVVRRLAPERPALAALAVAVVVFDVTLLAATQVVRERRQERESLVDFAARVATLIPPEVPLRSAGLPPTDVWVLAYRTQRPIDRARLRCSGDAAYLLPAGQTKEHIPLAVSARRKGGDVALVRCLPDRPSVESREELE